MPVRQPTQGGLNIPGLTGYQSAGVASPVYRAPDEPTDNTSQFWSGLLSSSMKVADGAVQQASARAYLKGQQDSLQGKEREAQNFFTQAMYEQGYNSSSVNTALAKFQLDMQGKAQEYVNAGKAPEEYSAYVTQQTNALLSQAGAQGMNLTDKDWQSWLGQVENTRNTATQYFQDQNLKRAAVLQEQSWGARGNAALTEASTAFSMGNPQQALENVNGHLSSIFADQSISAENKIKFSSQFMVNAFANSGNTGDMTALTSYIQNLKEFKELPTDVQTAVTNSAQQYYNQRASDESVQLYEYNSRVASVTDINELNQSYPMSSYINTVMQGVQQRKLAPGTGYAMVDAEANRRNKLQKAADQTRAYTTGVTISDIATQTGATTDKVETELTKLYAAQNGGYSAGGLALMQRGLRSGAQDMTGVGIKMLQQDAQSLSSVDWRNLKTDSEGKPLYPATVVGSLTNLQAAYNASIAAGNQVQANQLLSGLPDPVVYGIRQNVDARDLADVVGKRANDIASGKVLAMPADMPNDLRVTQADVSAGLFDFGIGKDARNRNLLGIQSWVFNSEADEKAAQARVTQINSAISNEYVYNQQRGSLPALSGDDMKSWLMGKVASRTVRVNDGTDNGALLVLPEVGDKQKVFGSTDNGIISTALEESVANFRKQYPQATTVNMDYDPFTQEIVFSGVNGENQIGTVAQTLPASEFRNAVRGVQNTLTNSGAGSTQGNLAVPGAGFVTFNTANQYNVQQNVLMGAVNRLVSYEGYTPSKGFSILDTHPTTGATLNEAKYVKQPTDTPQIAANKLSLYLNDKVLPQVMPKMDEYKQLPGYLQNAIFNSLVETTYHSGNSDAFNKYINDALYGNPQALADFKDSPLFKDAGAGSRRNRDRYQLLGALVQYRAQQLRN